MDVTLAHNPTDVVAQLGAQARDARRRLHLTQADLAELAGVSRTFVIEFERGHSRAELGKVIAVVKALGLDLTLSPRATGIHELTIDERAEALDDVIRGWKNGGKGPDKATQHIVRQYIAGNLTIDDALSQIDRLPHAATMQPHEERATSPVKV